MTARPAREGRLRVCGEVRSANYDFPDDEGEGNGGREGQREPEAAPGRVLVGFFRVASPARVLANGSAHGVFVAGQLKVIAVFRFFGMAVHGGRVVGWRITWLCRRMASG